MGINLHEIFSSYSIISNLNIWYTIVYWYFFTTKSDLYLKNYHGLSKPYSHIVWESFSFCLLRNWRWLGWERGFGLPPWKSHFTSFDILIFKLMARIASFYFFLLFPFYPFLSHSLSWFLIHQSSHVIDNFRVWIHTPSMDQTYFQPTSLSFVHQIHFFITVINKEMK